MDISMLKIFQIFGIVSSWAQKALADGQITLVEAVELATLIAGTLNVKTEIMGVESLLPGEGDDLVSPENLEKDTWVPEEPAVKPVEN